PCTESVAGNSIDEPKATNGPGNDGLGPGLTSAERHVPSGLPSLCHTSQSPPGQFWKTRRPFTLANNLVPRSGFGSMSARCTVPAAVPLLFPSPRPPAAPVTVKKSTPATSVSSCGDEPSAPARMSFTSTVPGSDALLVHSSLP